MPFTLAEKGLWFEAVVATVTEVVAAASAERKAWLAMGMGMGKRGRGK